jgi:hypothetical protein
MRIHTNVRARARALTHTHTHTEQMPTYRFRISTKQHKSAVCREAKYRLPEGGAREPGRAAGDGDTLMKKKGRRMVAQEPGG